MILKKRILMELESENFLSDRELTNRILGSNAPQQSVNQACRNLAETGIIKRTHSPIKNFIPLNERMNFIEQKNPSLPSWQPVEMKGNAHMDRSVYLKNEFNSFWNDFWETDRDYYSDMTLDKLSLLKMAVANINNLITYETTVFAAQMIADILGQDKSTFAQILQSVEATSANANGYDIECRLRTSYICEAKANIPDGSSFGAKQRQQIEKDINSLLHGKTKSSIRPAELPQFFKFLCMYEANDQVSTAMKRLVSSLDANSSKRVRFYQKGLNIDTDTIYILFVKPVNK